MYYVSTPFVRSMVRLFYIDSLYYDVNITSFYCEIQVFLSVHYFLKNVLQWICSFTYHNMLMIKLPTYVHII